MSVYDFAVFKNSAFSELITYTPSGGAAVQIRAVVFRKQPGTSNAKADQPIVMYPLVIEIDRNDISSVKEQEDAVSCADMNGVVKSFRVKKVMYSDAGCFKLGLM